MAGREKVKHAVEQEGLPGLAAARALSALQDSVIQVIYDFAVKHVYYAQNPTTAERIAIVATGGYGRGELAPGSDIDLLFVRPFKQTAWGESVIEFILYMLWDLGLKVGHATRSLAECVRLAKQDITIRTAMLEARYLWGDQALYEDLRKKFWNEVATGNGQDFVEAKLAERERAPCAPGRKPLSGRAQHQGRQGRSARPADPLLDRQISLSRRRRRRPGRAQCLHHRRIQDLPEGGSLPVECARASALSAGPAGRAACPSTCSRGWPPRWAIAMRTSRAGRWKPSCAPTSWWPRMWAI